MESWFERNIALLRERQPAQAEALALFPPKPLEAGEGFEFPLAGQEPGLSAILGQGPSGQPYLALKGPGSVRRLSSAMSPQSEDKALVDRFLGQQGPPEAGLTVLGLGLGYLLEFVLDKLPPETPLLALEARAELASAAMTARDLSKILRRPNFTLSVGPAKSLPEQAPKAVLARPANIRLDGPLYPHEGNPGAGPALATKPGRQRPPKILLFDTGYFLGREIQSAAKALGAPLSVWSSNPGATANGDDYARLLAQVKDFRPELVLTVNCLGFDAEGLLADALARLGIPVASWFVDSPIFILGAAPRPRADFFAFCWDRDYLGALNGLGYPKASYLPLASDPLVFCPAARPQRAAPRVAFVGDSLAAATDKYLALSGLGPEALPAVDKLARAFVKNDSLIPGPSLDGLEQGLGPEKLLALQALVTWRASRLWRQDILSAMPLGALAINGDEGWKELLPRASLGPSLGYYSGLPGRYRSQAINLNVTSAQMKTGLNQRVFDVPACRAFLLTDRRSQLLDLFAPDELATYQSPAEAAEKARWYLKRPGAREKVAAKAYRRVHSEHLYAHRLRQLTKTVFGSHR
ncbi:MAG: glycosyltransferase [Deltaproteobacteria bacterium]|jgi:spore maturation protein CgeB|nr:glycosyltransferase [Deltaproteobacteria bacterium]